MELLTEILSILGCNLRCDWYQSCQASQAKKKRISPLISVFFLLLQVSSHVANLDFHTFIYLHTLIICHLSQTLCILLTQTQVSFFCGKLLSLSFTSPPTSSLDRPRRKQNDSYPTKPRDNMVCIMKQHGNFFRLVSSRPWK